MNKLFFKFEDLLVKWNYYLYEIGDYWDCGGGRVFNVEMFVFNV